MTAFFSASTVRMLLRKLCQHSLLLPKGWLAADGFLILLQDLYGFRLAASYMLSFVVGWVPTLVVLDEQMPRAHQLWGRFPHGITDLRVVVVWEVLRGRDMALPAVGQSPLRLLGRAM